MNRQKSSDEVAQQRAQRHAARASQVYRSFLARLEDVSGMSAMQAENAAVSVLHALEQRIIADERRHLESQLPSRLRELLSASIPREHLPARKIDRDAFLSMVAVDVGAENAESAVRAVFEVLSELVSAGEIVNVVHQLPRDLREFWPESVRQATRSEEELAQSRAEEKAEPRVEMQVSASKARRPFDSIRDQVLALTAPEQLDVFRLVAAAMLREIDPGERLELLRELHEQVREIGEDERAAGSPEPPLSP